MGFEHLLTLLLRKHMIKRNQQEGGFILLSGTNKRETFEMPHDR